MSKHAPVVDDTMIEGWTFIEALSEIVRRECAVPKSISQSEQEAVYETPGRESVDKIGEEDNAKASH